MKAAFVRLLALVAGIAVVLSCDSAPLSSPVGAVGGGRTSGSSGGKDVAKPTVTIDTPTTGTLVNLGDSVLVSMHLHDDSALASVSLFGYRETGDQNLGTFVRTVRYSQIDVPANGLFHTGLRDTVIRRYMQPVQPLDSTLDSLIIIAVVKDSAGNADSSLRRVNIVVGPKVTITLPVQGDSVPAGVSFTAALHALSAVALHGQ